VRSKALSAVPRPADGIPGRSVTLKRKVGYTEEDEEVFQTRRELMALNMSDSSNMQR
jgi:hypothetical protein